MNNKEILFDLKAKEEVLRGMNILANSVRRTLGPQGQCVVIGDYDNHKPHVTKDGVTVAKNIQFENNYYNTGACLIREAALKTVSSVGDATTTSTVLAQAFINEAMDYLQDGANPAKLKKGVKIAAEAVLDNIKKAARPIAEGDIESIATISANNDPEIGKLISEAFKKITNDGVIVVEESPNVNTTIDVIQGMQFERGLLSPGFITDEIKGECVLDNPYILISEQKVNLMRELIPILEKVAEEQRAILIIAEDFDSEVIENLRRNKLAGYLRVCAVKAPSFGEYRKEVLNDIAILTGGTTLTYESEVYLSSMDIDMLGKCDKVIVNKDSCTIIGGKTSKELVQERVNYLKQRLQEVKATDVNNEFMTEFLSNRIAKLVGGIGTIHVGGATELEMKERKDRVDDAICATKAAIEEGVVAGGGITYLRSFDKILSHKDKDINNGIHIVLSGLDSVISNIVSNAGFDYIVDIQDHIDPDKNIGFDANNEIFVDMFEAGILNPAKSERLAKFRWPLE